MTPTSLPAWSLIGSLRLMKPGLTLKHFTHLIILCCAMATTAAFGQTTRTWDGGNGTGTDLGAATNWSGDTLPATTSGTIGDFATWDNLVAGNLPLTYNGGIAGGYQSSGVNFILTPNQVGSVTIVSPVAASANLASGQFWTNSSTAASLQFGNGSANVLNIIWRSLEVNPPYGPHYFINNSTAPNIICPNVRFQAGGGNPHTLIFGGSGDWVVTNNLTTANGTATIVGKAGTGKLIWAGPSIAAALGNSTIASPLDFEGGTVILENGNPLTTQSITNNGILQYSAPSQSQTLSGVITGTGMLMVSDGTLNLSGASTYTGNTVLTNSGTLILGSAHTPGVSGPIGVGGTILFNGGTLQFSAANTFDYSTRFSANPNQAFKFDTAGQNVTFATGLSSTGGTFAKAGSGNLTLSGASAYDGSTTVRAGKLVFQGSKTGSGDITVSNSAALGVTDTGTQVTPGTLTLGTGAGVTLEFNNVNNTATPIISATTIAAGGTVTVNVNGGTFSPSTSYPLLHWTGGTTPTFVLGTAVGAVNPTISVSGNTLYLNVTQVAYEWTGASSGLFDLTSLNWLFSGSASTFVNGGNAVFDDTATGQTAVTLNGVVLPASVTANNSSKTYSITTSSGNEIDGTNSLTKANNGTLTLSGGFNAYTGATTVKGGILSVSTLANGGSPSDIGAAANSAANLVLNGGTLQYTNGGAASIDRLFTLGTGGGAIDASSSGALILNNTGSVGLNGSGARVLTLTGTNTGDNTLSAAIADNGGATSLAKNGPANGLCRPTTPIPAGPRLPAGSLQVGAGGASGSLGSGNITDNGSLIFNRSGTLTNGTIGGTGSVTVDGGGTVVLPGNNTYTAGTTISNGTLQVGVGGATGSLNNGSGIVDNGTIIFDSTTAFAQSGVISGTGNLVKRGSGLLKITGANTFTGWTLIDSGATLQIAEGNQGAFASSVVTNNGTLLMTRQDNFVFTNSSAIVGSGVVWKDNNNANAGDVTLIGANTYTGGTVIGGGGIIVGDGATSGSIIGNVFFTNSQSVYDNRRWLEFYRSDNVTFPGNISYSTNLAFGNRGIVIHAGTGMLTLTGNNDYPGGTIISNSVLQVGAGGTSGAIGSGPVTDNGLLVFNRSDDMTFGGVISGSGSVVKTGAGKLTLTATNTAYLGYMTVSNGTLNINGEDFGFPFTVNGGTLGGTGVIDGPVTLDPGTTLAPGVSVGTLTFNSDLSIGGNMAIEVDKSLASSNDLAVVNGSLNNTGTGTLTVANLGPALSVGDKFTLFSKAVGNGSALTVTGAGATWQNDLASDGSITVLTVSLVNPNPPVMQVSVSGNSLSLAWPTNLGWTLQTNSVGLTATNQWFSYPGSEAITNVNITINPGKTNVFFRMIYTP